MRGLQRFQFIHQRIISRVGDLRRVQDVIQVLVAANLGAQFGGTLGGIGYFCAFRVHISTHLGDYKRAEPIPGLTHARRLWYFSIRT